jgi:hypothetical protein
MKEITASKVLMGMIEVVSILIIIFSVLAIDCNRRIERRQSCQNIVSVTAEELWQSFPG